MNLHAPGAIFSADRSYRYTLTRFLAGPYEHHSGLRILNFIGLNPSTADEYQDDPTIRRCLGFARSWGFGELVITNAFAWRSTDPKGLRGLADPIGADNDEWLARVVSEADLVIVAWSGMAKLMNRDQEILAYMQRHHVALHCLGLTKAGYPRHPLYMKATAKPSRFS